MPTVRIQRRLGVAAVAVLGLTVTVMATALVTAPPRAWRTGAYVVPLEDLDLATSDMQNSLLNNSNSSYADFTDSGGKLWPLGQSGMMVIASGGQPGYPVAFYNQPWSPDGNASKGAPILVKSHTLATPAKLTWTISPAIHANRLRAVLMGVNIFDKQVGKKLGVIRIHRSGGSTDIVRDLAIGTDIRHFKTGNPGSGLVYQTSVASGATSLWTGKCSVTSEWCYVDELVIDVPAAEVKNPIIGITVEGYRVLQTADGNVNIYGGMRLHGLTFEQSYEATNNGASVQVLSQGDCSTGGSGWAAVRYGGRRLVAGGTVYGPKRNIKALGCGVTSGTMVVNYHNGGSLKPHELNAELQEHNGFVSGSVGALGDFTASVQTACATLATAHPLNACNCCQGATCATACPNGPAPALGADADEVQMCCTVAATAGLPAGGVAAVGAVVEFYPDSYLADGVWSTGRLAKDLGTMTACNGAALAATPAVVDSGGTPVASLEVSADTHPFNQTGCTALNHPAFAGLTVHPTTHLPCKVQLRLATIGALEGTPSLTAASRLKFFPIVDWQVIANRHALTYSYRMALLNTKEDEARQVEAMFAAGNLPILRVKDDEHFLVGKGTAAAWQATAISATAISVPATGGFVGTYLVADPGLSTSPNLIVSMTGDSPESRNLFSGWRLLAPGTPTAGMSVTIHSPAHLLATNSLGQRCGWHPQLGMLDEIAGASYGPLGYDVAAGEASDPASDSPKQLLMTSAGGPYQVAVVGTGFGAYSLEVRRVNASGKVTEAWQHGTTKPGKLELVSVDGSGAALVLKAVATVDGDGDGSAAPADCDDASKAVGPQSQENCSGGIDDDCDGLTDAADPSCDATAAACLDADADGFAACTGACKPTKPCGDCDDSDGQASPGGKEGPGLGFSCNDGRDNDCDGAADLALPACLAAAGSPFGSDKLAKAVAASSSGADAGAADSGAVDAGGPVGVDGGSDGQDAGTGTAEVLADSEEEVLADSEDLDATGNGDADSAVDAGSDADAGSGQDAASATETNVDALVSEASSTDAVTADQGAATTDSATPQLGDGSSTATVTPKTGAAAVSKDDGCQAGRLPADGSAALAVLVLALGAWVQARRCRPRSPALGASRRHCVTFLSGTYASTPLTEKLLAPCSLLLAPCRATASDSERQGTGIPNRGPRGISVVNLGRQA
ncbi:MAG: hypothetical protein EXR77_14070 [Myxococcales bacterium]|nr:hypothetical protein [Myxococcales bacterium]